MQKPESITTLENPNDMVQHYRGDGTTTRQIKASTQGAHYVTPNVDYTRGLAHSLDRSDLRMEHLSFFDNERWRGLKRSQIVVDHATRKLMSKEQRARMFEALQVMHD